MLGVKLVLAEYYETNARAAGETWVCGIDEVGRGPLAGPVTAAAVMVPQDADVRAQLLASVNDSKVLSVKKREHLAPLIHQTCSVSIAHASVAEIDKLNIREATFLAMTRAVAGLRHGERSVAISGAPPYCLIDGRDIPTGLRGQAIVKGDACELAIACASIVAKVARDALMADLATHYPHYGWASNMGYGSAVHLAALQSHGATPHHRSSFAPVRDVLERAA